MRGCMCLISILISLSAPPQSKTQDTRTVTNGTHTFIYYLKDKRSVSSARDLCSSKGSRLVEIYSEHIDTFLRGHMKNGEWFHTGGENPSGNQVIWYSSNTQSAFTSWVKDKNDGSDHECVVIQDTGWIDEPCSNKNRYICESAPVNSFRLSSQQITVTDGSTKQVTCEANGIPTPSVRWSLNSAGNVPTDTRESTYQKVSSGISTLDFTNVTAKDEGNYSCTARNSAGLDSNSQMDNFGLKVPSTPTIVATMPISCSSNISVKWRPAKYGMRTRHKIIISKTNAKNGSIEEFNTPNEGKQQDFERSLSPWTRYTVSIKPCPNQKCMEHYTASNSTTTITEGVPGTVENLEVTLDGTHSCFINWGKPRQVTDGKVTSYKIIVNGSVEALNSSISTENNEASIPGNVTNHTFEGQPNGTYWIAVQASTCAGKGEITWSKTVCVTPKSPTAFSEAVVGAIIGGATLILVVALVIFILVWKRKSSSKASSSSKSELVTMETIGDRTSHDPTAAGASAVMGAGEPVYQNHGVESPYANDGSRTLMSMESLEGNYNTLLANKSAGFVAQFEKLIAVCKTYSLSCEFAENPALKSKNRYKNILPFDLTRVPIQNSDDGYINACFIDGYLRKKKFIATQGPLPKTVNDFWQMVVEQDSFVIVMLAKCVEAGKKKCEKYWPDLGETSRYGAVTVTNLNEARSCGFVCRTLQITSTSKSDEREKIVSQFHFLKWPDHGFPTTTSHIMQMHRKVTEAYEKGKSKSPIVVHCSAGAGRTGTWIGYDYLLNEGKSTGKADAYECVAGMRKQRREMVQNVNQYILVHKLLLESHVFGDTDVPGRIVPETFADRNYKSKKAPQQFKNLARIKPMDMITGTKIVHAHDRLRIKSSDGKNPFKASYIEAYDEASEVIVASAPRHETLNSFWEFVAETSVSIIVMITEDKRITFNYWEQDSVNIVSEEATQNFVMKKLQIGNQKNTITHILLHVNLAEEQRDIVMKVNSCINRMSRELRECNGAALVHCKDGVGMSGVFCAIMNLLERLKVEDRVDVFRAVKDLRDCKEGMMESKKLYELCYEAVLTYLQDFETYSNFK